MFRACSYQKMILSRSSLNSHYIIKDPGHMTNEMKKYSVAGFHAFDYLHQSVESVFS